MKTIILAVAIALTIAHAHPSFANDISSIPWTASNLEALLTFNKTAVLQFINQHGRSEGTPAAMKESEVWEFEWVDLAGDGKYALALIGSSGPCCVDLLLYRQAESGKVTFQAFDGAGKLSNTIKDLNGDGQKELILYSYIGSGNYQGITPQGMWPQVYRLKGTKYVEASRDFLGFYHDVILPQLARKIDELQRKQPPDSPDNENIAVLKMERDKILRVIERQPTAGLEQARAWMNSSDPQVIGYAVVVFGDIGGHDDDAREAEAAFKVAQARERAARQGS